MSFMSGFAFALSFPPLAGLALDLRMGFGDVHYAAPFIMGGMTAACGCCWAA